MVVKMRERKTPRYAMLFVLFKLMVRFACFPRDTSRIGDTASPHQLCPGNVTSSVFLSTPSA